MYLCLQSQCYRGLWDFDPCISQDEFKLCSSLMLRNVVKSTPLLSLQWWVSVTPGIIIPTTSVLKQQDTYLSGPSFYRACKYKALGFCPGHAIPHVIKIEDFSCSIEKSYFSFTFDLLLCKTSLKTHWKSSCGLLTQILLHNK